MTATVMRNSRFDLQARATQKKMRAKRGKTRAPKTCGIYRTKGRIENKNGSSRLEVNVRTEKSVENGKLQMNGNAHLLQRQYQRKGLERK